MDNNKTIMTHNDIRKKTVFIKTLLNGLHIKPKSNAYLLKLLEEIEDQYGEENTPSLIFKALIVDRIFESVSLLSNEKINTQKKYLKDLLNGNLDFISQVPSRAKDIFWELEVYSLIKDKFPKSYLEEPDIVLQFDDEEKVGIACKRVSSEKSIQKVISKAVKQIEKHSFIFGIVAINIDDLYPEKSILNKSTAKQALEFLNTRNEEFIQEHQRHFRKYIEKSRIIAVIVSSSVIADIKNNSPRSLSD